MKHLEAWELCLNHVSDCDWHLRVDRDKWETSKCRNAGSVHKINISGICKRVARLGLIMIRLTVAPQRLSYHSLVEFLRRVYSKCSMSNHDSSSAASMEGFLRSVFEC